MDDFSEIQNLDDTFPLRPNDLGSVIAKLEGNGYKVKKAVGLDDQMYVCNSEGAVGGLILGLGEVLYISPQLEHREEMKELLRKYIV